MPQRLLESLKAIRQFFTEHGKDRLFRLAVRDYMSVRHPTPQTEHSSKFWAELSDDESDRVVEFEKLVPPMQSACDDALRVLTSRVEIPYSIDRDKLIEACEKLRIEDSVATYETRYGKLFDRAINLLEIQLVPTALSENQRVIDYDKIQPPNSKVVR